MGTLRIFFKTFSIVKVPTPINIFLSENGVRKKLLTLPVTEKMTFGRALTGVKLTFGRSRLG